MAPTMTVSINHDGRDPTKKYREKHFKEDTMDVFQLLVLIIGFSGISTPILLALILWRVW